MKKRLQVCMNDDAWAQVEAITNETNEGFEGGSVTYSDVINEMILTSKVDIRALQLRHTDLRRSLRAMASKQTVDIDAVIKSLMDLKAKAPKRKISNTQEGDSE